MYWYESWTIKKAEHQCWCLQTVVLEETLESNMDSKEIKPVKPKGNQTGIFIGGTYAETEAPILWPPDAENWVIGKDPDAGKDWRQEEKGKTDNKMIGWHHQLNAHAFEQTPGDTEEQGGLVCCSPWGCKELTCLSNWTASFYKQKQCYLHTIHLRQEPIPLKLPQDTVSFTLWYLSPSLLTSPDLDLDFGFYFEGMGKTLHALLWCTPVGLMLKLKLQYLGHLMRRTDSFEKTLMLGKTEGRKRGEDRGWDGWMASLTWWTWVWVSSGSWW